MSNPRSGLTVTPQSSRSGRALAPSLMTALSRKGYFAVVLAVLTVFMAGFMMSAPRAWAHDAVVTSTPADGSTVTEFPSRIVLTMSGNPQNHFNTVAITDNTSGKVVAKGTPDIEGNEIKFTVPSDVHPEAGQYTIGFQITSSDGHSTRGSLKFIYKPASSATSSSATEQSESTSTPEGTTANQAPATNNAGESSTAPASSDSNSSSISPWTWISGLAVVVVIIALVIVLRRLGRKQ